MLNALPRLFKFITAFCEELELCIVRVLFIVTLTLLESNVKLTLEFNSIVEFGATSVIFDLKSFGEFIVIFAAKLVCKLQVISKMPNIIKTV